MDFSFESDQKHLKKYQSQFFPKIPTTHHPYNSYVHEPQHMYVLEDSKKVLYVLAVTFFLLKIHYF